MDYSVSNKILVCYTASAPFPTYREKEWASSLLTYSRDLLPTCWHFVTSTLLLFSVISPDLTWLYLGHLPEVLSHLLWAPGLEAAPIQPCSDSGAGQRRGCHLY